MHAALSCLAMLAAALMLNGRAAAQDQKSSPLPSHLPLGVEACFGRVYDAAHLREHPRQRVTSFHILRDFSPDRNSESEPQSRQEMLDGDGNIALTAERLQFLANPMRWDASAAHIRRRARQACQTA